MASGIAPDVVVGIVAIRDWRVLFDQVPAQPITDRFEFR